MIGHQMGPQKAKILPAGERIYPYYGPCPSEMDVHCKGFERSCHTLVLGSTGPLLQSGASRGGGGNCKEMWMPCPGGRSAFGRSLPAIAWS